MAQGRNLKVVVFLEGIRIPVSQVTVSAQANRALQARIALPASRVIEDLLPKTHVMIYFEEIAPGPRPIEFEDSLQLLFEGEIVGSGWSQSATGQTTAYIKCQGLANYFERAPAYFFRNNFLDQEATETVAFTLGENLLDQARFLSNPNEQGLTSELELLMLQANVNSITRAFVRIFERTAQLNQFFRAANVRLKLVNSGALGENDPFGDPLPSQQGRIALKDDPEAILLYNPDLTDLSKHLLRNQDIVLPLQDIMARLMELANYQFWPQPCPSFETDEVTGVARPVNFAIKPTTFFSIPPAFNVFFPGSSTGAEVDRNFLDEPTRLRMRFTQIKNVLRPIASSKYAPAAMENVLLGVFGQPAQERAKDIDVPSAVNTFGFVGLAQTLAQLNTPGAGTVLSFDEEDITGKRDNPATRAIRVLLGPGDNIPVESDETIKGIIPREVKVPASTFILSSGRLGAIEDRYYSQLAEFLLFLAQHETRTVQITSDFNPNVAIGFPFLLLQETMGPKFGELASLTHTIIDESGGTTQMILSYAHDRDVISVDGRPGQTRLRAAPLWVNKAFLPENVDLLDFEAPRIDPNNPDDATPLQRGLGGWRYFFGDSGTAFWRNYPAGAASSQTVSPELVDFSKRTAAELLLEFYLSQDDASRDAMVQGFGTRRIATLRDMSSFLGFTVQSEQRLGGAIFEDRLTVRAPIEELKLDLDQRAVRL